MHPSRGRKRREDGCMDVGLIGGSRVLGAAGDVARIREAGRQKRLFKLADLENYLMKIEASQQPRSGRVRPSRH